ncbi:sugar-binding transcriptional regulator [Bacillus sp. FJAT-49736]|uniref:sugar-binding transcriptional regulator n=1 Tax=Bacillus sp. FJAT-49736 TaxID=2833582 RepID=UPI001BC8D667|nr:sugar-binding transcriptional regulator [Bacillus sp. FJAT-49736]MBS4174030.1 sugar-binding transcriptional regulator [Bacillus sp. FJAT-49736]
MYSFIEVQKKLLPDLLSTMQKRYQILKSIYFMEPVGRRTLAGELGHSERVLRSEVEFLKDQKLISIQSSGMSVTDQGLKVLQDLESMMREITGINEMEEQLKKILNLQEVVIVPGNSDETPWVKGELGRACAKRMKLHLDGKNIIAVTGGTTMATVADMLTSNFTENEIIFVPARGGIGEDVKNQANTICAKMAENTGSQHRVLYVPDQVSKEVYDSIVKEPMINEVLHLIKNANIVLHGIGDAHTMAKRRKTKEEDMRKIIDGHAVGEAFGYYFNEDGDIVHKVPTIGLQLNDLPKVKNVLAVAGGTSKAKAIKAFMKATTKSTVLITDEGAAKEILNLS